MKIIAVLLFILFIHESQGQPCKELSIIITIDSLVSINSDGVDSVLNTIEQFFLKNTTQDYFSGECIVKRKRFYGDKIKYELYYCREKQICIGVIIRNIDKFTTDTMAFLYDLSKSDMKTRADTVIKHNDYVYYELNIATCLDRLARLASILKFYITRDHYIYLNHRGIFSLFREDEPPYMKNDYVISR